MERKTGADIRSGALGSQADIKVNSETKKVAKKVVDQHDVADRGAVFGCGSGRKGVGAIGKDKRLGKRRGERWVRNKKTEEDRIGMDLTER